MKLLFFLLLSGGVFFLFLVINKTMSSSNPITPVMPTIQKTVAEKTGKKMMSIFIPYWTVFEDTTDNNFQRYIYFGIAANENGIDINEEGYNKISIFKKFASNKESYLTLRMVDTQINNKILSNKSLQEKIIHDTIAIAEQNNFSGVVLDLETSSLAFDSVTKKISDFIVTFSQTSKNVNMPFAIALYGDTYYRARPYDIKLIEKHVDEILIMAYDFHKARGNPGPNFPLEGKNLYGYDFKTMISDFKKDISVNKLTVIFGMFGYDWAVDKEYGSSISSGQPLSTNAIQLQFIDSCSQWECKRVREEKSREVNISYKDKDGKYHSVWFEDIDSVIKKREYLKQNGINSYSYWAYSYFKISPLTK